MVAPQNECAFDLDTAIAAAERWSRRKEHHEKFEEAAKTKDYTEIDTPERCAARANRLLGQLQDALPEVAESLTRELPRSRDGTGAAAVTADNVDSEFLERVIGKTRDFQFIEFLEKAIYASKSVGRIVNKLGGGRCAYGTGFLVSPRLLMTNHHVLTSAAVAARCTVEFDYQRDRLGRELPVRAFALDPTTFFLNNKELDFALVAVAPGANGRLLANYPWCPLIPDAGKIVAGEPINVIQHPLGERKQVVIRENRLIDSLEDSGTYYHYEADTEPGSSGSPVFNDQWEVIALHHSGVPKRNSKKELLDVDNKVWRPGSDPSRLAWVANEGVRISRLVDFISGATVSGEAKRLLKEFLEPKMPPEPGPLIPEPKRDDEENHMESQKKTTGGRSFTVTIPLHITVTVGTPDGETVAVGAVSEPAEAMLEKVEIDFDYSNRRGYDPLFLGFEAPFPRLTGTSRPKAFALPKATGEKRFVLKYHHYSVIFNKERNLAFVAGVNLDPTAKFFHKRDKKDEWFFDGRVPEELQAGEDLYSANPLDRGHLVRRADAGWGATAEEAKEANDDTFHFTNCSPQHAITNQGKSKITDKGRVVKAPEGLKLWGKLEEHVAAQGKSGKRKLCVFNGPVFRDNDPEYRNVLIPREFWKVVVFAKDDGEPGAAAFVLTQAELIQDLKEEFEVGEYKGVQVRIEELEERTGLDFSPFGEWDAMTKPRAAESFSGDYPGVVLGSVRDVVLL